MAKTKDLSELQRTILNRVGRGCPAANAAFIRGEDTKSPAKAAAFSRAIRRLQRRGLLMPLVVRRSLSKGERFNSVALTPEGVKLLKTLS
jgi:hypothetical protein